MSQELTFKGLVSAIGQIDSRCQAIARRAVNVSLTLRNWMFGLYISEFEFRGLDRATYGERLLIELSKALELKKVSNSGKRQLYHYLAFYRCYPQIGQVIPQEFAPLLPNSIEIVRTLSAQFKRSGSELINNLSYSHLELLSNVLEKPKREYYEDETLTGGWTIRELRRHISTLYFERTYFIPKEDKPASPGQKGTENIFGLRDPYVFEFLNLKPGELRTETDLECALRDHLKDFLMELGNGFCFEARQKRLLIGSKHYFVDLVFYHRIMKCHVLIELKLDEFQYKHLGQLKTYVSWYKKNMMTPGDSTPIGILLCTQKDEALVEYALEDIDQQLFVTQYECVLPVAEEIRKTFQEQIRLHREKQLPDSSPFLDIA